MYKLSFNHKLPDSGKRECQRRYMHLGFDRPPPPSLSGSLQGPSIINRCQADFELVTQPGPFCAASGPETPAQENSPIPSPLLAQKKSLGAFRGGRGEDESSCTGRGHLFSRGTKPGSPPDLVSAHLKRVLCYRPSDAGGRRVTISEVHQSGERRK